MKKLLLFLLLTVGFASAQQTWRPLGDDDFNRESFDFSNTIGPRKMVNKNGHLYVFRMERGFVYSNYLYRLFIGKYDGTRWTSISMPELFTNFDNIESTVDNNGTPVVFYNDPTINKAVVKIHDGANWINLGEPISTQNISLARLAIGSDNLPVVFYKEGSVIVMKKFDGVNWNVLSMPTEFQPYTSIGFVLDNNNIPYVFSNYQVGSSYNSFVRKFNGSTWDEVGITGFNDKITLMAFDANNVPYMTIGTGVKKFVDNTWQDLPDTDDFGNNYWTNPGTPTMIFDANNTLFLGHPSVPPFSSSQFYDIRKLVGDAWIVLSVTVSLPINQTFEIIGDELYIYFNGGETNGNIQVKKLVGNTLVPTGGVNLFDVSMPGPFDFSICNGFPMISYLEQDEASVRRLVDNEWIYLGTPKFSENDIGMTRIKSGTDGQIYVAYNNIISSANDTRLTVKKLGALDWEPVGPINFTQSAGASFDFVLSNNNEPYVLYMNGRVQKFDGTNWSYLGSSAYTGNIDSRLALDSNNTPYIAFLDPSNGSRIAVKKLNGNVWEYVDQAGLNGFTNSKLPRIIFDNTDNLYLGFADSAGKLRIKKLNNGLWEAVGPEIFSPTVVNSDFQNARFLEFSFSNSGSLHALYNDYDGYRISVNLKKFNGASWEIVGQPNFSSTNSRAARFEFWENDTPLVAFSQHNGIFAKYFGDENALSTTDIPLQTNSKITIAPNPTANSFTVTSNETIKGVSVFDLLGKCIIQNHHAETIDIGALQRGIYIVKVNTDGGTYSQKIVKK